MTNAVTGLWEPFGLRSNPFFQAELKPVETEPASGLFIGREEELTRVTRRILSDGSSRTIVQGTPGVGKTSFANRLKADLAAHGIVSYEHPLRITSDMAWSSFVAEVLRTLLRIRAAAGTDGHRDFWAETARMLEGEEVFGGSVGALGVSAGISRGFVAPRLPPGALYEHLGAALRALRTELGAPVVLHVNNLENVDGETAAVLLRDLRDYLLLDGAHWVFVGALGVEEEVFRRFDQVGGIFPAAETLEPLRTDEVRRLLRRRYEHLRIAERGFVAPVELETAGRLYGLYQGDLRNFLRLLADAAERALGLPELRPMTETEILRAAVPGYARALARQLGDNDFGHMRAMMDATDKTHEFRVTDIAKTLRMTQPAASALVERLTNARTIRQVRVQGRSVYYRPVGATLVALGITPDDDDAPAPQSSA